MKTDPKPGNGPAVIIHNDGEPGPHRVPLVMPHPQIQQGVIGLPDGVGLLCLAAIEQIKDRAIGFTPGMGQGHQPTIELLNHLIHTLIAWQRPAMLGGDVDDLPMHEGGGGRRGLASTPTWTFLPSKRQCRRCGRAIAVQASSLASQRGRVSHPRRSATIICRHRRRIRVPLI